ncbi:MAG: hypothetical protein EOP62_20290 [Sphingomonadales bacterium]|nr:MAG: hypothetical protein EOP62_20290 [Sphingomonadales bacterium]
MIRGILLLCAVTCAAAAPVSAGERKPLASAAAVKVPVLPVSMNFTGYDGALALGGDYVIRLRGTPDPSRSLASFETRTVPRFDLIPGIVEPADPVSSYAAIDLRTIAAWRLTEGLGANTASANGSFAVRDVLMEHRKPRAYRPSMISTMLVLRIDGERDSAPFSIGGGGVAAALWGAMPR